MRNQFFRTLSAWCFKSTLSTYEPTMLLTNLTNDCSCTAWQIFKRVCLPCHGLISLALGRDTDLLYSQKLDYIMLLGRPFSLDKKF